MYTHLMSALPLLMVSPLTVPPEQPPDPPGHAVATAPAEPGGPAYAFGYEARTCARQGADAALPGRPVRVQPRDGLRSTAAATGTCGVGRSTGRAATQWVARTESREHGGYHGAGHH